MDDQILRTNVAERNCRVGCLVFCPQGCSPGCRVVGVVGIVTDQVELVDVYTHVMNTNYSSHFQQHIIPSAHCILNLWVYVHAVHNLGLHHIVAQVLCMVPFNSFLPRSPSTVKQAIHSPQEGLDVHTYGRLLSLGHRYRLTECTRWVVPFVPPPPPE